MKRRNIGVCVTGYNWEYETRVIDGIYRRCQELDINLLVFANLLRRPELGSHTIMPENVVKGETEIFSLINYGILDGIIILGDSIVKEELVYEFADKARKHDIPVVNVNDPLHILDYNIILSDKTAMEFVMRHLVEDHGYTKINFIGGFPGNLQTEERLAAYRKILTEHDIPVEESRIAYGEFWSKAADVAEQFMSGEDRPDAMVFASDTMAIFAIERLRKLGYKIPKDVAITGFDGIRECEMLSPSLTTVRRAFAEAGIEAVNVIDRLLSGQRQPDFIYVNSLLVKNSSCRCKGENDISRDKLVGIYNDEHMRLMEFNFGFQKMNTRLAGARNTHELYGFAHRGASFFNLKRMYICICSEIENGVLSFINDNESKIYNGLSDTMISMLKFGHEVEIGTEFPTSRLLPEPFLNGDKPVFFAFSPMYYQNIFLGYAAYEPSMTHGMGDYFSTWLMSISSNVGGFYTRNELQIVLGKLENLYMRDPLTGLFNRRGMQKLGKSLLDEAKNNSRKFAVVCADIDGLKPINDEFGHEAGDNAIMQTANALNRAFPESAVCTRTGGDEYTVILLCEDENVISQCIAAAYKYLENYNANSGLGYKVGCSFGYYVICPRASDTMDALIKTADAEMYKQKLERKKNRIK